MTATVESLAAAAGVDWFDYQLAGFETWMGQDTPSPRLCLYYRTGAGKTVTALAAMALRGVHEVLVIAPPATHDAWALWGTKLGVVVTAISHAKFRMPGFLVSRSVAVIADEFHLFGGHGGSGWKKLDRLSRSLKQPVILASATPNYNDAERVYCIQHILAPHTVKGGFLEFLYQNCETEQNPFGQTPIVTGFKQFKDAVEYLAALPEVVYLPDNVTVGIVDLPLVSKLPDDFEEYGLDRRTGRLIASQMEERHRRATYLLVDENNLVHEHVLDMLIQIVGEATTPVLMFSNSSKVAAMLYVSCTMQNAKVALLTGGDTTKQKALVLDQFRRGELDVLIGTATLATGVDGLDKVCDMLVIVNDTDDNALRRQLIGRILPRGADADASNKQVYRLQMSS